MRPATDVAEFIGGFVAVEGTFVVSGSPSTFTFAIGLGGSDAESCERFLELLGVGHIHRWPRRKAHYDDEVAYSVQSLRATPRS